jgi:putative endonuclease
MFSQQHVGKEGEKLARHFLERQGYEIIITNWRHHHLEIDIVAQKNNILHIVEVKTLQGTAGFPEESVNYGKFINLQRAAEAFMNQFPLWTMLQFDIISVTLIKGNEPAILFIEDIYY